MSVLSWFRRRGAGVRPVEEQGGGAIAVLDPEDRTDQEPADDAEQQAPHGVPAARTAPDTDAVLAAADTAQSGAVTDDEVSADRDEPIVAEPAGIAASAVESLLAVPVQTAVAEVRAPAGHSHEESRPERPDTGDEAMGVMDNLKGKAEELKDKASHLAGQHAEKIDEVVDKAGEAIDKATKGKYSDKIATGAEKAKSAVDDFAEKPDRPEQGGTPQS
ncbi:antitoxin [Kitasatospora mediocidica]|uniref:antitoxin n=1 Tax=Kitasatospora mediocidica TaxID=58352 RepID=UPI001E5D3F5D|nr:antitoxin [Kitasatospora mediocidica]